MLKRIVPMMLLGLCVFAQHSTAQQPPVSVLLDNARDSANQVVGFAGDTRISGTWADLISGILTRIETPTGSFYCYRHELTR